MVIQEFSGLLEDNRDQIQKDKQYSTIELGITGTNTNWRKKLNSELKRYPIWNQWRTGACVGFSTAKRIAIEIYRLTGVWVDLSPAFIYTHRKNQNSAGMYTYDAEHIIDQIGVTLDALMPSANLKSLTETEINALQSNVLADNIAKAIADGIGAYVQTPLNMDAVAEQLEQGKGVTMSLYAEYSEYRTEVPIVKFKDLTRADANIRHRVCLTDYYIHEEYGKVFQMDDSWGVGNGAGGRRIITEEFFYARMSEPITQAQFSLNPNVPVENKPHIHLTAPLEFIPLNVLGEISDTAKNALQKDAVAKVQDILKYEGMFSTDIPSTGYYGAITAKAIDKYQRKYNVASDTELNEVQGKRIGAKTIEDMNKRYA